MILKRISILNYKNLEQVEIGFSAKLNCFFGQNGMGKTNLLDAVYFLSFCKSSGNPIDSQNIRHEQDFFVIQGFYEAEDGTPEEIYCGMKRRSKKQFKRNKKEYGRFSDHIGFLQPVFSNEGGIALSLLTDTDILLITGIASPAPILERLGDCTKQIDLLSFGDHHDFTHKDMQQIRERFNKLKGKRRLIITTEKDATRLINHPGLDAELKPFIYALPIEIEILQNQQDKFNQHIIDYVRENTRNRSHYTDFHLLLLFRPHFLLLQDIPALSTFRTSYTSQV